MRAARESELVVSPGVDLDRVHLAGQGGFQCVEPRTERSPVRGEPRRHDRRPEFRTRSSVPAGSGSVDGRKNGMAGCATTTALIGTSIPMSSSGSVPVRHIPTAPSPFPPESSSICSSSGFSSAAIRPPLVALKRSVSGLPTQSLKKFFLGANSPGRPKSSGTQTVKPASLTVGEPEGRGGEAGQLVEHDHGRSGAAPEDEELAGRAAHLDRLRERRFWISGPTCGC